MYDLYSVLFRSPRGANVLMWLRQDTNDYNTCRSALTEDEYGLAGLTLTGRAMDVGAHVGAVTIALLRDNPDLEVVAVEPVPDNVALLLRNLDENGLAERCEVIPKAAGAERGTTRIAYRYTGSENATHHAFIGNATLLERSTQHAVAEVQTITLAECVPLSFLKIDCEGCEWGFLSGPALAGVERIHGEWHPTEGHTQDDIADLLFWEGGFAVTFTGPEGGPGGFVAVRP